jgi:hypothetical protein
MQGGSWEYRGRIMQTIMQRKAKPLTVTYNRKPYKIKGTDARDLAAAYWSFVTGSSYGIERGKDGAPDTTYPSLNFHRTAFIERMVEIGVLPKPKKRKNVTFLVQSYAMTPRGHAIARSCFEQITGLNLDVAASEVKRLSDKAERESEERKAHLIDCLSGLHRLNGRPVLHLKHGALTDEDEVCVAEQIAAWRDLAAEALAARREANA